MFSPYIHITQCVQIPEKGTGRPQTRAAGGCEPLLHGCRGPLQDLNHLSSPSEKHSVRKLCV